MNSKILALSATILFLFIVSLQVWKGIKGDEMKSRWSVEQKISWFTVPHISVYRYYFNNWTYRPTTTIIKRSNPYTTFESRIGYCIFSQSKTYTLFSLRVFLVSRWYFLLCGRKTRGKHFIKKCTWVKKSILNY